MRTLFDAVRTVVGAFVVVLYTIAVCSWLMVVTRFRPDTHHTEVVARGWGRLIIFFAGVRNTIEGLENVDRSRSYVFVSNHLSNLDAPYHLATMPVGVRFLAKKELYKIPLFGPTLRAVGMVETDRHAHSAAAHRDDQRTGGPGHRHGAVAAHLPRGHPLPRWGTARLQEGGLPHRRAEPRCRCSR